MSWTKCGVFREEFGYLWVGGSNQWLMGAAAGEAAEVGHAAPQHWEEEKKKPRDVIRSSCHRRSHAIA